MFIFVGLNLLGRNADLQAYDQFRTTLSTSHDIEQVMKHLSAQDAELVHLTKHLLAQDAELLRHAQLLMHLLAKNGISLEHLAAEGATTSHLDAFEQAQSADGTAVPPGAGK
jgi:hypothetical protein